MRFSPRLRKKFTEIVEEVSYRKAWRLFALFRSSRGAQPKLRREWRDKKIRELEDIVEAAYLPYLRRWVRSNTHKAEVRFNRARIAKDARASEVRDRLIGRWGRERYLAYVSFAGHGKCLKVGRSDHGLSRIVSQQDAYYFRDATRVAVFFPKHERKKMLPALECALTHVFLPFHLYRNPAMRKYRQKCRACHEMRLVRRIAKKLYPA